MWCFLPSCFCACALTVSCLGLGAQQSPSPTAAQAKSGPAQANSAAAQANQQQARALVDKMIQALGGDAYMRMQDLKCKGRYGSFSHGSVRSTTSYLRYWQWPDKERVEFANGSSVSGYSGSWPLQTQKQSSRTLVLLHTGDRVYEKTAQGTKPEAPEQLSRYLLARDYSLAVVLRRWLQEPGVALFYDGPTVAENHAAEKVTIMNARNQAVTLMIAADTHLPIKKVYTVRDPVYRDRDEEVEIYDNWKVVQGIATPFNTLQTHNGEMISQQYIMSVHYNNHLSPSVFDPGPNADR